MRLHWQVFLMQLCSVGILKTTPPEVYKQKLECRCSNTKRKMLCQIICIASATEQTGSVASPPPANIQQSSVGVAVAEKILLAQKGSVS